MTQGERKAVEDLIDYMETVRKILTDIDSVTRFQEMIDELQDMIEPEDPLTGPDGQFGMGA